MFFSLYNLNNWLGIEGTVMELDLKVDGKRGQEDMVHYPSLHLLGNLARGD